MKKYYLFLATLAASLFAYSCAKEADVLTKPEETKTYEYVFQVSDADDNTKTTIDGTTVAWETNDQIGIFAAGTTNTFGKITTLNPVQFPIYLSAALSEGEMVYAYYPYSSANSSASANSVTLTIPASQSGDFDAMPQVALPYETTSAMAKGSNNTDKLLFCNLGSVIRFLVYSSTGAYASETVQSIQFTPNKAVAGPFSFDLTGVDYDDQNTLSISGYTGSSVTLTTSPTIGTTTSDAGTAEMVIAPDTYFGSIVLTTNVAKYTYSIAEANKITFNRSAIKKIGLNLESATCVRELNGYEIPSTINFKTTTNVDFVQMSGVDYYAKNASYFYGSTLKFDANNDQIVIPTKSAFGNISIVALYNTGSTPTSKLKVYGSADGSTYTEIDTPSFTYGSNVVEAPDAVVVTNYNSTYRYIKMVFTKASGNLAVGSISIAAPDLSPRISADNITGVSALGVTNALATYSIANFAGLDDVSVKNYSGCVTSATIEDGKIKYSIAPNYATSSANGTITLQSSEASDKVVNVSQEGDTFVQSGATGSPLTLVIPNNATTASFTITSAVFGWNASVTPASEKNLTIKTGADTYAATHSGSANASAQTITISSTAVAEATEQTLGTIDVYRNNNATDSQKISITIKKASTGGSTPKTFSGTFVKISKASSSLTLTEPGSTEITASITVNGENVGLGQNVDSTKGAQVGTGSKPCTGIVITVPFTGSVSSITLNTSGANSVNATLAVSVGGSTYKSGTNDSVSLTNTATAYTFTGSASGAVTITITNSSAKAIYLKNLSITGVK